MSGKSPPRRLIQTGDPEDRRQYVRWSFRGTVFPARIGKKMIEIRLKDLSRGGASGMMDEPVAVGDYITIEFDEMHKVEAQVRWVRNVMAGMEFNNPLSIRFVMELHERAEEERRAQPVDDYLIQRRTPKKSHPTRSARAQITPSDGGARHL